MCVCDCVNVKQTEVIRQKEDKPVEQIFQAEIFLVSVLLFWDCGPVLCPVGISIHHHSLPLPVSHLMLHKSGLQPFHRDFQSSCFSSPATLSGSSSNLLPLRFFADAVFSSVSLSDTKRNCSSWRVGFLNYIVLN